MLEIQNVSKTFNGAAGLVRAVERITLAVSPGDFLAVRGPSGCGKSTLLLLAGALLRPDAGTVLLDGQDIYALSSEQRSRLRARASGLCSSDFTWCPT